MGEGSKIEWTDHTFNPWWGCTRTSPAVPFHFKQWGEWLPDDHAHILPDEVHAEILIGMGPASVGVFSELTHGVRVTSFRIGKHRSGRLLDGVTHDGLPVIASDI